jgi:hypothetical protein
MSLLLLEAPEEQLHALTQRQCALSRERVESPKEY